MPLFVVATPIGNAEDITLRAIKILKSADIIVGEERKVAARFLRTVKIEGKEILELNEHSDKVALNEIMMMCKNKNVALISDCGTPAFCDPGADLVRMCRKEGFKVEVVPGPSSLMSFLGGAGTKIKEFYFRGFLSAKTEIRNQEIQSLKKCKVPVVLMDTPYRLTRLLQDLNRSFPNNFVSLGLDLSMDTEEFIYGRPTDILKKVGGQKREFVMMLYL